MTVPPQGLRPAIQIFVCENERPEGAPLPCCARAGSGAVSAALRRAVSRRGMGRQIWITGSRCLTFCSAAGTTVAAWPAGAFFQGVRAEEVDALLEAILRVHRGGGDGV